MKATLVVMAGQFCVLFVLGWAVLAPLPRRVRELTLPVAPLLGAAFIAAVTSTTNMVIPAKWGTIVVVVAAAAVLAFALVRGEKPWLYSKRAIATALVAIALGLLGLSSALMPSHWVQDNRATPSGPSIDTVFYAAEADWLADHVLLPGPQYWFNSADHQNHDAPSYGPVEVAVDNWLRTGGPAVEATLDTLTGSDPVQTITPLTMLWLLLCAPAGFVAARLMGVGPVASGFAGFVVASSGLTIIQATDGSTDGLLGSPLGLLTFGFAGAAVLRKAPIWPAVLALAGFVAVYSDLLVVMAPALVALVIIGPRSEFRQRLSRGWRIALGALALVPVSWFFALQSGRLGRHNNGDGNPSAFQTAGTRQALARFAGLAPIRGDLTPMTTIKLVIVGLLFLVTLLGLARLMWKSPERWMWLGGFGVAAALVGYGTATEGGYFQERTILLVGPWALFAAVVGLSLDQPKLRLSLGRNEAWAGNPLVAAGLAVVLVVWGFANRDSAIASLNKTQTLHRHADASFDVATAWADAHQGKVTVLAPDLARSLWVAWALKKYPHITYPVTANDAYLRGLDTWDGSFESTIIAAQGTQVVGPVEASSDSLRLVELTGSTTVVAPMWSQPGWSGLSGPGNDMGGCDGAKLLVLSGPQGSGKLTFGFYLGNPSEIGRTLVIWRDGAALASVKITEAAMSVTVDLGTATQSILTLDVDGDQQSSTDPIGFQTVTLASQQES